MIAQRVAGVRMEKHVERTVVQRQPLDDVAEVLAFEGELIRPHRVRADRAFMEAADLRDVAKACADRFP
jgi:hypothetical protein